MECDQLTDLDFPYFKIGEKRKQFELIKKERKKKKKEKSRKRAKKKERN
jgi:hypothetical protein